MSLNKTGDSVVIVCVKTKPNTVSNYATCCWILLYWSWI